MADRLSARATLLLVVLGFGCAFAIEALVTGRAFTGEPAAMRSALAEVTEADGPVAQPRLRPVGPVPALRERPRRRHARAHRPERRVRKVVKAAPRVQRAPVLPAATVQPAPTATPRYIPPASPRPPAAESPPAAPKPTPKPKPAPTSAPPDSGEFDTTGESP